MAIAAAAAGPNIDVKFKNNDRRTQYSALRLRYHQLPAIWILYQLSTINYQLSSYATPHPTHGHLPTVRNRSSRARGFFSQATAVASCNGGTLASGGGRVQRSTCGRGWRRNLRRIWTQDCGIRRCVADCRLRAVGMQACALCTVHCAVPRGRWRGAESQSGQAAARSGVLSTCTQYSVRVILHRTPHNAVCQCHCVTVSL